MKTTPQPTTSKRPLEDKEEEPVKKFKPNTLKHISLNCNLSSDETVQELFEQVRIIGVDDVTYTGARHYHIIGIPKLYKRAARDVSRISLEQMGISHHLAKQAYNSMHFTDIGTRTTSTIPSPTSRKNGLFMKTNPLDTNPVVIEYSTVFKP